MQVSMEDTNEPFTLPTPYMGPTNQEQLEGMGVDTSMAEETRDQRV